MRGKDSPYDQFREEPINELDYISDIYVAFLMETHCALFSKLRSMHQITRLLDIGGDVGIHAHLMSMITNVTSSVSDIRNRIHLLDVERLRMAWIKLLETPSSIYSESWLNGQETGELSRFLRMNIALTSKPGHNTIHYSSDNFFSEISPAQVITSFSSLDYFCLDDFVAKCSSLQRSRGDSLFLMIPNLVFHRNPARINFKGVLSATATLSVDQMIRRSVASLSSPEEFLSRFYWFQNGEGPMVLENYCISLEKFGYRILDAKRPSIANFSPSRQKYSFSWYGEQESFSKLKVEKALGKARKASPTISNFIQISDFFAPYYYISGVKT